MIDHPLFGSLFRRGLAPLLVACVFMPYPAQAFTCLCDGPTLQALLSTENARAGADSSFYSKALIDYNNIEAAVLSVSKNVAQGTAANKSYTEAIRSSMVDVSTAETAARIRTENAKTYEAGKVINACEAANRVEGLGAAGGRQASRGGAARAAIARYARSISTPSDDIVNVSKLTPKDLAGDFVGSDAGTMTQSQEQNYEHFVETLLPAPPVNPKALPSSVKGSTQAKIYETVFKKWEAGQNYYGRMAMREAVLMHPSIPVTPEQISDWQTISKRALSSANYSDRDDNGNTTFPDQWGTLTPVNVNGQQMIGERDYLRTEIFRRYANPDYVAKTLQMANSEALLKELIQIDLLNARMNYEVMNAVLHEKQSTAIANAHTNFDTYNPRLNQLQTEMRAN